MEYNSFYGGRQGASFVIQEKYKSIKAPDVTNKVWNKIIREDLGLAKDANISNEQRESWNKQYCMVSAFQQGNGYKTVNYDEYVIIDTVNKNDPDNGKVYRRGYDYTNNMGGALYVGQIVGPAGLAPHTEIKTIEEIRNIQETDEFEYRRGEGEYSVTNASLVAGMDSNGNFNDTIEWVYCSVRDANSSDSTAHIGFRFPYTVIEFTAESASAYTPSGAELASRIDNKSHPFYEKWQLQVPKGIKGDALRNLKIVEKNGKTYLVYESVNYDSSATGTVTSHDVGEINYIKDVTFNQNTGTITVDYSAATDTSFQLKYPSTIVLDSSSQRLKVTYTDNTVALIGDPINYVLETAIPTTYGDAYRYHLLIRYSAKKPTEDKKITYNGHSDWFDLGVVKSDNGILIGGDLGDSSLSTQEECIAALNIAYPEGHEDGKIMTAGEPPRMDKGFFAFNYTSRTWYYLGSLGSTVISVLAAKENSAEAENVPPRGIWFVIEDRA